MGSRSWLRGLVALAACLAVAIGPGRAHAHGTLRHPVELLSIHMINATTGWAVTSRSVLRAMHGAKEWMDVTPRGVLLTPMSVEDFDILADLITDEPRAVLDVGAGTGDIARGLVRRVEHVDAVDFSQAMIAKGKTLPDGDHPHLRWIHGAVETVALDPPYALVTAGESMHWMNWEIIFPRFGDALTPGGVVAIVHRAELPAPWQEDLDALTVVC